MLLIFYYLNINLFFYQVENILMILCFKAGIHISVLHRNTAILKSAVPNKTLYNTSSIYTQDISY